MLHKRVKRERSEYLERKESEERRKEGKRKRELLLNAYERNIVVPEELRTKDGEETFNEFLYDVEYNEDADEYSKYTEPKILITTSRDPSDSLVRFAKSLRYVFPNSQKINRGKHVIKELATMARENGFTDFLMVNEHRGTPSSLMVSHFPYGPTLFFSLHNVVSPSETNSTSLSTGTPGVVFDNLSTKLGLRVQRVLSHLFPPLSTAGAAPKKVISFTNAEDFILFRQHQVERRGGVEIQPLVPQFDMRLFEIRASTFEVEHLDKEYVYRPYLNTSRKKLYL